MKNCSEMKKTKSGVCRLERAVRTLLIQCMLHRVSNQLDLRKIRRFAPVELQEDSEDWLRFRCSISRLEWLVIPHKPHEKVDYDEFQPFRRSLLQKSRRWTEEWKRQKSSPFILFCELLLSRCATFRSSPAESLLKQLLHRLEAISSLDMRAGCVWHWI